MRWGGKPSEKRVLRKLISDICCDINHGGHVDLDWITETINDNIDCRTCLDEKVLSYYGECAMCADCSDGLKIYDYIKSIKAENEKLSECLKNLVDDIFIAHNMNNKIVNPEWKSVSEALKQLKGEK